MNLSTLKVTDYGKTDLFTEMKQRYTNTPNFLFLISLKREAIQKKEETYINYVVLPIATKIKPFEGDFI